MTRERFNSVAGAVLKRFPLKHSIYYPNVMEVIWEPVEHSSIVFVLFAETVYSQSSRSLKTTIIATAPGKIVPDQPVSL